jgi:phage-related protein
MQAEILPIVTDQIIPMVKNDLIPIFRDALIPIFKNDILPAVEKAVKAFSDMSPEMQKLVIGITAFAAVIGPVLVILGAVASGIGAISALFAAGGALATAGTIISGLIAGITALGAPILILIGVVALLVVAWTRDWGGIQTYARTTWTWIMDTANLLYQRLEYTYHAIIMAESTLRDRTRDAWNAISSVFSTAINAIMGLVSSWYSHSNTNFNLVISILQILLTGWRLNWTEIQTVLNLAQAAISSILNTLYSTAQNLFNRIVSALSSLYNDWRNDWNRIQATINDSVNYISNYLTNLYNTTTTRARDIANKLIEPFSSIRDTILSYTSSWYNAGWAILDSLYNGVVDGFERVINKAKEELAELAKYLPSSPAKKGPFSKLPNWDAIFVDPMLASVSKMGGTLQAGLNSISTVGPTSNSVSTVYEGSQISIGPNNISGGMDIQKIVDEINRRVTAQRRARGYIL